MCLCLISADDVALSRCRHAHPPIQLPTSLRLAITRSDSPGSLTQIASTVYRLNIVGVVVAPGAAHASWFDVIRDGIFKAAELPAADRATRLLLSDFFSEQAPHGGRGPVFAIAAGMARVLDAAYSGQGSRYPLLSSAAEARLVNGAELVLG